MCEKERKFKKKEEKKGEIRDCGVGGVGVGKWKGEGSWRPEMEGGSGEQWESDL